MSIEIYKRLDYLNEISEKLIDLDSSEDALRLSSFYGLTSKEICFKNQIKSFRWDRPKLKRCPRCHVYFDFNLRKPAVESPRCQTKHDLKNGASSRLATKRTNLIDWQTHSKNDKSNVRIQSKKSSKKKGGQMDHSSTGELNDVYINQMNNQLMKCETKGSNDSNQLMKLETKGSNDSKPNRVDNQSNAESTKTRSNDPDQPTNEKTNALCKSNQSIELSKSIKFKVKKKHLIIECKQCNYQKSFIINSKRKQTYEQLFFASK